MVTALQKLVKEIIAHLATFPINVVWRTAIPLRVSVSLRSKK